MPKTKRSRRSSAGSFTRSYSEKNLSPVIKFGVVFFWVAVIVLVAWVVKLYM